MAVKPFISNDLKMELSDYAFRLSNLIVLADNQDKMAELAQTLGGLEKVIKGAVTELDVKIQTVIDGANKGMFGTDFVLTVTRIHGKKGRPAAEVVVQTAEEIAAAKKAAIQALLGAKA